MSDKVSVYSLSDLKTTLDDHIPIFLTSPNLPASSTPLPKALRLEESNTHSTIRLIIGYSAVSIALYIFYLDYYLKVPWNDHKGITFYAVIAYTLLNGLLTLWIWYGEKGVVFVGSRKAGAVGKDAEKVSVPAMQIRISSRPPPKKFEPTYRLEVEWSLGSGRRSNTDRGVLEAEAPFMLFFQADGTFVSGEFERWFKREVPVILGGTADAVEVPVSKKVVEKLARAGDEDDVIVVQADAANATQSGRDPGSAKKRPKKKA